MKLNVQELEKVLRILEKIDAGSADPKIPGPIGRFLRQYRDGTRLIKEVLDSQSINRRVDGAISGQSLGKVEVHPLSTIHANALAFPLGEAADTLAISEQLGGLAYVCMWLKGPVANAAFNILTTGSSLTLEGDYRWTPLARLTTGEAVAVGGELKPAWQEFRCLKAVADDLLRPPHALEFVVDYRIGRPGLKFFRCVCAERLAGSWQVLPALGQRKPIVIEGTECDTSTIRVGGVATLLVYCEPWSSGWTIARALPVNINEAVGHAVTWIDFQHELRAIPFDASKELSVRGHFRSIGLTLSSDPAPNLIRSLLPVPLQLLRSIRRIAD